MHQTAALRKPSDVFRLTVKYSIPLFFPRVSMPMHAERDIVMSNPSVRLSVCPSHAGIVSKWMHISSNSFRHQIGEWFQFFERYRRYKIPAGTPSADRNRRLSRKRYAIGSWLLWIANRKSWATDRSVSLTNARRYNDLEWPYARGHNFLKDLR